MSSGAVILFATIYAHSVMIKFIHLSIRDHPSISLEMVKFVFCSVPSTNTSELLTCIYAVESLQRSDQRNLAKHEGRLKKLNSFKYEVEKSINKLKGKYGI